MQRCEMQRKSTVVLLVMLVCLAFGVLAACSARNNPTFDVAGKKSNFQIAYPSSINICMGGCQAHQNWIKFYLVSDSFLDQSLRLKTSIWPAQILTLGISSAPCIYQDRSGYTCVEMELSHHLLWGLTALNLTPLSELRDTSNWWLEYTPLHH
jgi:hypothetical protein